MIKPHDGTRLGLSTCRWTTLGRRLGLSDTAASRARWMRAASDIQWQAVPPDPRWLDEQPLAAVSVALFGANRARLARAGAVDLPGGRRLVGLADRTNARWYLLVQPIPGGVELLTEAVVLFTQQPHPRRPRRVRVA